MISRPLSLAFAAAVAIGIAAPAIAQPGLPSAASAASYSSVDAFYATHNNAPIWTGDEAARAAAQKFAAVLSRASIDGLPDGSDLAADVESALVNGQLEDDKLISSAWVRYVQALRKPTARISYGDPALAPRMPSAYAVLGDAVRASSLAEHVEAVAVVNPLYSALREQALKHRAGDDARVAAALAQLRIVPAKGRAILVDAATARLWMLEDGRSVDTMKVIVGKKATPTPMLAGTIHYVTLNPFWNIPADVARTRVAPLVLKRGVSYLKAARYVAVDRFGQDAAPVDPAAIDWKAVADGTVPVHLRQLPGGENMMGALKVGFTNDHDIFLHDTPRRELFAEETRTYSMGCIRLEHADRLARWLLGRDPTPNGNAPEQHVQLDRPVPVYVTYLTANVKDGRLAFAKDVYGLDRLADEREPVATAAVSVPH